MRSTGHRDSILSSDSLMESIELSPPGLTDELWQPEPFGLTKPQNINPVLGPYDSMVNELSPSSPIKEVSIDKKAILNGFISIYIISGLVLMNERRWMTSFCKATSMISTQSLQSIKFLLCKTRNSYIFLKAKWDGTEITISMV